MGTKNRYAGKLGDYFIWEAVYRGDRTVDKGQTRGYDL